MLHSDNLISDMIEIHWHLPAPDIPVSQRHMFSRPCSIQDRIAGVVRNQWLSLLSLFLRSLARAYFCSSFAPSHSMASVNFSRSIFSRALESSACRCRISSSCVLLQVFASAMSVTSTPWSMKSRFLLRHSKMGSSCESKVFHSDSRTFFDARR